MSTSQNDDNLDEGFEDLDAAAEAPAGDDPLAAGEESGELAAPTRNVKAGGGKKNIMILGGLLSVLLLGGGGAYMFLMGEEDMSANPPVAVPAPAAPSEATFASSDPSAQPPAVDPAVAVANPAAVAPVPEALSGAPGADPAATPAATPVDPAAIATVDVASATTVDTAAAAVADPAVAATTPADPAAAATPPVDAATPPVDAATPPVDAATPPVDTAAEEPADLGAPPAEEATATPLTPAPVTPAPAEQQPDLPMPEQATAPVTVTTTATQPAGKTAGTTPAGTNTPNDAELAIVQNAAILDQVTQPGTVPGATSRPFDPSQPAPSPANAISEVEKLLQQEAIVRPLPPTWLQVKKNYNADDMDTRLTVARTALAQNRNAAALQLFTELRHAYPKDSRVLMGRAVSLQKLGQTDDALAAYEELLNANPKNLEALTNMLGLLKSRDPQLAIAKLSELRDAYPYQPDITAQLGVALGQAGEYEKALRYLEMAEAMNPGSAYVLYNKAVLYDKMGHATAAGDLYRQLIRMSADGELDENLPLEQIKRRLSVLR